MDLVPSVLRIPGVATRVFRHLPDGTNRSVEKLTILVLVLGFSRLDRLVEGTFVLIGLVRLLLSFGEPLVPRFGFRRGLPISSPLC